MDKSDKNTIGIIVSAIGVIISVIVSAGVVVSFLFGLQQNINSELGGLHSEIGNLRESVGELRGTVDANTRTLAKVQTDINDLRVELQADINGLRVELRQHSDGHAALPASSSDSVAASDN